MNSRMDELEKLSIRFCGNVKISRPGLEEYISSAKLLECDRETAIRKLGYSLLESSDTEKLLEILALARELCSPSELSFIYGSWIGILTILLGRLGLDEFEKRVFLVKKGLEIAEEIVKLFPENPGNYLYAVEILTYSYDLKDFERSICYLKEACRRAADCGDTEIVDMTNHFINSWSELLNKLPSLHTSERICLEPAGITDKKRLIVFLE